MYQRYIANPDGTFRKTLVDEAPPAPTSEAPAQTPEAQPAEAPLLRAPQEARLSLRNLLPQSIDVGDALLALIILLLFLDGEEGDTRTLLLALAAGFFL